MRGTLEDFNNYRPISGSINQSPLYRRILLYGVIRINTVAKLPFRSYRVVSNKSYQGGLLVIVILKFTKIPDIVESFPWCGRKGAGEGVRAPRCTKGGRSRGP
jgi:hypothetical protein